MSRPLGHRVAAVLVLLASLLGVAGAREWAAGASAVDESDAALARGDRQLAIAHARRAAEAAVPFSPYPQEGYARLESIARAAERKGDLDLAGFAWRAVRSAAAATRPARASRARVEEADDAIVRLARASFAQHRGDEGVVRDELATDEIPSPWASLVVAAGALAFAVGLGTFARAIGPRAVATGVGRKSRWLGSR